jgi:regulator of protease activity HflC (stomatin/prohibitin superfamily)
MSVIFDPSSGEARVTGLGHHWKHPFDQKAVATTGVIKLVYFDDIRAVTKDKIDIFFSVVTMYGVPNKADSVLNLFKKFGSEFDNSEKVHILARYILKKVISKYSIHEIDVEKRSKINHEFKTAISDEFEKHGLFFYSIQLKGNVRIPESL